MYSRCLLLSLPAAPLTFAPHNKRAPLNALYGVKVGVLESCHLIGSEDFAIPQSLFATERPIFTFLSCSPRTLSFEHNVVSREHDYIAFDEYYNEPIGRSFGNCDIYNTTITWLRKHDHMARYFPIFLVFGAKFQYFDNGE